MPSRLEQTDEGFDSQDGADANSATSRVDGVPEDSFDDQGEALDVSHPMRLEPYQPYGRKRSRGSEEEQREAPAIAKGDATRMTKRARVDKFNKGGESEVQQTSCSTRTQIEDQTENGPTGRFSYSETHTERKNLSQQEAVTESVERETESPSRDYKTRQEEADSRSRDSPFIHTLSSGIETHERPTASTSQSNPRSEDVEGRNPVQTNLASPLDEARPSEMAKEMLPRPAARTHRLSASERVATTTQNSHIGADESVQAMLARAGEEKGVLEGGFATFHSQGLSHIAYVFPRELAETCQRWEHARERATQFEAAMKEKKALLAEKARSQEFELQRDEMEIFDLQEEIVDGGNVPSSEQTQELCKLQNSRKEKEREAEKIRREHYRILEAEFDNQCIAERMEKEIKDLFWRAVSGHQWCDPSYVPPSPLSDPGPAKFMEFSKHRWPWEHHKPQAEDRSVAYSGASTLSVVQDGRVTSELYARREALAVAAENLELHRETYERQYIDYAEKLADRNSKTLPNVETEFGPVFLRRLNELSRKVQDAEEALEQTKLEAKAVGVWDEDQASNFPEMYDRRPDWNAKNNIRYANRKRGRIEKWVNTRKLWLSGDELLPEATRNTPGSEFTISSGSASLETDMDSVENASSRSSRSAVSFFSDASSLSENDDGPADPIESQIHSRSGEVCESEGHAQHVDSSNVSEDHGSAAIEDELAKYVEQEGPSFWRCKVPNCKEPFITKPFWESHVKSKHVKWFEELKNRVDKSGSGEEVFRGKIPVDDGKARKEDRASAVPAYAGTKRKSSERNESGRQEKKQRLEDKKRETLMPRGRKRIALEGENPPTVPEAPRKRQKTADVAAERQVHEQRPGNFSPATRKRKSRDDSDPSDSERKRPKIGSRSKPVREALEELERSAPPTRLKRKFEQLDSFSAVCFSTRYAKKIKAWNDAVRGGFR